MPGAPDASRPVRYPHTRGGLGAPTGSAANPPAPPPLPPLKIVEGGSPGRQVGGSTEQPCEETQGAQAPEGGGTTDTMVNAVVALWLEGACIGKRVDQRSNRPPARSPAPLPPLSPSPPQPEGERAQQEEQGKCPCAHGEAEGRRKRQNKLRRCGRKRASKCPCPPPDTAYRRLTPQRGPHGKVKGATAAAVGAKPRMQWGRRGGRERPPSRAGQ